MVEVNALKFFMQFTKSPKTIGAVLPSSRALAREMLSGVDFSNVKVVVEYGSGTGVFTNEILDCIHPGTVFLPFETNTAFCAYLREKYDGLELIQRSAAEVEEVLYEKSINSVDLIISGLPFAIFEEKTQEKIVKSSSKILKKNGEFRTFSYIQSQFMRDAKIFKNLIGKNFDKVDKSKIVWGNFPPAFVYRCFRNR